MAATDAQDTINEFKEAVNMTPNELERWLERSTPDIADLTELLQPYPADELLVHPVSPLVNRIDNDEPALLGSYPPDRFRAQLALPSCTKKRVSFGALKHASSTHPY